MSGWDVARYGWLLACTLVASVTDVRERRIPNWLVVLCAAATPVWWLTGVLAWSASLWGGVAIGGPLLVPALLGAAGMGDAKLAGVIGLGVGWQAAGPLLTGTACTLILGAGVYRGAAFADGQGWPLAPAMLAGVVAVAVVHWM